MRGVFRWEKIHHKNTDRKQARDVRDEDAWLNIYLQFPHTNICDALYSMVFVRAKSFNFFIGER